MATAALAGANPGSAPVITGASSGEVVSSEDARDPGAAQENASSTNLYSGALLGESLRIERDRLAQVGDVLGKKSSVSTTGDAAEPQLNPFRGSTVIYRNSTTALSLNPDGATIHTLNGDARRYNPTYVMTMRLLPTFWFNEYVGLYGDAWFG